MALTPGFLKYDGTIFILDPDVEGPPGPAGPPGPSGVTVVDLSDLAQTTNVLPIVRGGLGITTLGVTDTVLVSTGTVPTWVTLVNANISASAAIAVSKLAPGSNNQVLQTIGGATVWAAAPLSVPGGSDNQFQINSSGTFAGVAGLTWNTGTSKPVMPNGWEVTTGGFTTTFANTPTANRVITFQDSTDTVVGRSTTDTLVNKLINATNNTITDSGTAAGDILVSDGAKFSKYTKGSNGTFWGVSGGVAGYYIPTQTFSTPTGTGIMRVVGGTMQSSGLIGSPTQILRTNGSGTDVEWVAAPSSFSAPSGTGIMRVVSGSMQSSGFLGGASQLLRTNASGTNLEWFTLSGGATSAGAAGTVQISDGGGGFSDPGSVLAGSSFISVGATPSTTGNIRLGSANGSIQFRNASNSGNNCGILSDGANNLYVGSDGSGTNRFAGVFVLPSGNFVAQCPAFNFNNNSGQRYIFANDNSKIVELGIAGQAGLLVYKTGTGINVGIATSSSSHGEGSNQSNTIFIPNISGVVSTPSGGGFLMVATGSLQYRGSSGTQTTVAPADPHCKQCGRDFMHEWGNDFNDEHLSVCMPCLLDSLETIGINVNAFSERELY